MGRTKSFNEIEVLEKAMCLFWKKGYHDTSVQDLVDHLGINRASLYDTFGGKELLFEKSFAYYQQQNAQMATDFLSAQPRVKEGLKNLFARIIEQAVQDPDKKGCFVVNTTTELIPNEEKWLPILHRNRQTFEAVFLRHLQRGVVQGEISGDKDVKSIAALLYTLNNGLQVVAKINPSKNDLMKIVEVGLGVLD